MAGGEDPEVGSEANPEAMARQIVLRRLTARARTRHELAQALQSKRVPEPSAVEVLNRLEQVGLIDDAQFARDWVESRQGRRSLSRGALRRELQLKGVDRDLIEEALEPITSEEELAAARALAEKKMRSMGPVRSDVRYRRLAGALARRGFSAGVVAAVLAQLPTDEPDLDL
jgi:regulatory protein